jgi:tetratricopeptide (TPR) repeat protein
MKRTLYSFFFAVFALLCFTAQGQSQLPTDRDSDEIKRQAKRKIEKGLGDLLNALTFDDLTEAERQGIRDDSYKAGSSNQLFYNTNVIIEDDLLPVRKSDGVFDLKVDKYLANLDLFYTKSTDRTIEISDVTVSNLKQGEYLYMRVYFTSLFKGTHKQHLDTPYKPQKRVAEIRAERQGKKWATFISLLAFAKPDDAATSTLNDVTLAAAVAPTALISTDSTNSTAQTAQIDPEIEARRQREAEQFKREEAQRQREAEQEQKDLKAFNGLIEEGNQAFKDKDYEAALEAFTEANSKNKFGDITPSVMMRRVKKAVAQAKNADIEALRDFRDRAETARRQRNYALAIDYYQKLRAKKPDSTALVATIAELQQKASTQMQLDERLNGGQQGQLVKEYNKLIDADPNNSDYHLARGRAYMKRNEQKDAGKAQADLTRAIELDPLNLGALLARADLNRQTNNLPQAIADYSSYIVIDPRNEEAFAQRARLRLRTNNFTTAEDDFSKAIAVNPKVADYYTERGLIRQRNRQFALAVADFNEAINLDEKQSNAYFWRGLSNAALGRYDLTGVDFTQVRQRPDIANLYVARMDSVNSSLYANGLAANEEKRFEQALEPLSNAIAVRSDSPKALYERGRANLNLGEYETAIADFTASLTFAPNEYQTYDRRAEAWWAMRRYDQAAADYQKSATINPENYPAMLGEGTARYWLGQFADAMQPLVMIKTARSKAEKAGFGANQFRDTYHLLGRCEAATSQYDKAVDDYSTALKFDGAFAAAYFDRAVAYDTLKNLGRAIEDYQQATSREPRNANWAYAKALAFERKGDWPNAAAAFTDVLAADSTQALKNQALLRRGIAYLAANQSDKSLVDLETPALQQDTKLCGPLCWYSTGLAHLYGGQPDDARLYFDRCLDDPGMAARANYAIGCAYLQKENKAEALTWFGKAFKTNEFTRRYVQNDNLLTVVNKEFRKDADFAKLVKESLK